jgi:Putative zinc-finger
VQEPSTDILTCKAAIALVFDYVEATLGADVAVSLEDHLRGCHDCTAYVNTYCQTRQLIASVGRVEIPAAMKERLREFLLGQLSAPHPISSIDVARHPRGGVHPRGRRSGHGDR